MNNAMEHYKKIAAICREDNVILVAKDDIENTYNDNPNIKKGDELYAEFGCESTLYARGFDAEKTWKVSVPDTHFHLLEFKHAQMTDKEKIDVLSSALRDVAGWVGKFPETGKLWPDGSPMSYGACFGSNGERDFMRSKAEKALIQTNTR